MSPPYEKEETEPVLKSYRNESGGDDLAALTAVPLVTANFIERDAVVITRNNTTAKFSTSICGLFQDPYSRSDCCALNCCGLLSVDRTRYLLTKQQPKWMRRILLYIVLPWVTMEIFNLLIYYYSTKDLNAAGSLSSAVLGIYMVWFSYFLYIARAYRRETREIVIRKMYQHHIGSQDDAEGELNFLRLHTYEIERAHPCCRGQYPYLYDAVPMPSQEDYSKDFCARLWYCGYRLCGLCQCFGLCAIGQEDREVNRLVSSDELLIDYVTHQLYDSYYPEILTLRTQRNDSLIAHFRAVSNLSIKLLKALAIYLSIALFFAFTDMTASALGKMIVVCFDCFFRFLFMDETCS